LFSYHSKLLQICKIQALFYIFTFQFSLKTKLAISGFVRNEQKVSSKNGKQSLGQTIQAKPVENKKDGKQKWKTKQTKV